MKMLAMAFVAHGMYQWFGFLYPVVAPDCFGATTPQASFFQKRASCHWVLNVESFLKLLVYKGSF